MKAKTDILKAGTGTDNDNASSDAVIGGCDLGQGATLPQGHKLYLFRHKRSRDAEKPEAIAEAKNGDLYLYGQKVARPKGSLVQPALRMVQERLNDRNSRGELISLDAWHYWYVKRQGQFLKADMLRDQTKVVRRGSFASTLTLEELELS